MPPTGPPPSPLPHRLAIVAAACGIVGAACGAPSDAAPTVRVLVAASAAAATERALAACEPALPVPAQVVSASSSALARQLEQGAPGQLFLSANPRWMDHLDDAGRIEPALRRPLLSSHLVVVAPADAPPVPLGPDLALGPALGEGRLAVGDPDHVPVGLYAKEALQSLGQWDALEPRLARAGDARAALALVERAEAPLGMVYATDAAASAGVVVVAEVPTAAHAPVVYPLAVLAGEGESPGVAQAWDCLLGAPARAVFAAHGFSAP